MIYLNYESVSKWHPNISVVQKIGDVLMFCRDFNPHLWPEIAQIHPMLSVSLNHASKGKGHKLHPLEVPLWGCTYLGIYLSEDVPLVEFMHLLFTHVPGESYHGQLRSLLSSVWHLSSTNKLPCLLILRQHSGPCWVSDDMLGYFGVSILHCTLTWTTGSLTCIHVFYIHIHMGNHLIPRAFTVWTELDSGEISWQAKSLTGSIHPSMWWPCTVITLNLASKKWMHFAQHHWLS